MSADRKAMRQNMKNQEGKSTISEAWTRMQIVRYGLDVWASMQRNCCRRKLKLGE